METMLSSATGKSSQLTETQQVTRDTGQVMSRKIWLPKLIYSTLPFFYVFAGIAALAATIYINGWTWVLPHYVLFAVACLHMGILVYRRRNRPRS